MTEPKREFFQYRKKSVIAGLEFEEQKWTTVDRHTLSFLLSGAGDNTRQILDWFDRIPETSTPIHTKIGLIRKLPEDPPEQIGPHHHPVNSYIPGVTKFGPVKPNQPTSRLMGISPGAATALETAGTQAKAIWMENRQPIPRKVIADAHRPRATPEAPPESTDNPPPLETVTLKGKDHIGHIQEVISSAHGQVESLQGLLCVIQRAVSTFPLVNTYLEDLIRARGSLGSLGCNLMDIRDILNQYLSKR